jgi:3'(2'),5'-bisphosphate nucleotidase
VPASPPPDASAPSFAAFERELAVAQEAARQAAAIIARHYAAAAGTFRSKDDGSPVTAADLEANAAITATLSAAFPEDALLCEEAPDDGSRLHRSRVWIVDPLDGTRDFLARTGDFTVNIGLVVDGRPVVTVVHQPGQGALYHAARGAGSFRQRDGASVRLGVSGTGALSQVRVGISRHNAPPALLRCLEAHDLVARTVRLGASSKYLALAAGELDALVTLTTGEKEWDTCAPELIVAEAGGLVTDVDGRPLAYNQRDIGRRRGIVASNGRCHAELLALVRPCMGPA